MDASPAKRRALAPLDANSRSPAQTAPCLPGFKSPSIVKPGISIAVDAHSPTGLKRASDKENVDASPVSAKKQRLSGGESIIPRAIPRGHSQETCQKPHESQRQRSNSPDESSIFDSSLVDTSQATTITEPDVEAAGAIAVPAPPALTRQPSMTREEARQKASALRSRLRLASYKVKTNQTDVPLERLQRKPLHGQSRTRTSHAPLQRLPPFTDAQSFVSIPPPRPRSRSQEMNSRPQTSRSATEASSGPRSALPRNRSYSEAHASAAASPEKNGFSTESYDIPAQQLVADDENLASCGGLKGGAVKGLMNLSRSTG
ncbi:hypothetical protein F5Y15DRAFT_366049 [Xylariaceae sp. FL0016]|nr:hypothetical protein F5Y15DRAFT_366049 [Xylariaceae sp. FL0016]